MPQTHKLVRDAVQTVMTEDDGFNAALATALPFYGITDTIALDWLPASTSVLYARLGSTDFANSKLTGRLTLEIAPNGSQWTGETRGVKWSGRVGIRLVFRIRYSYRDNDDEPLADDAVTAIATAIEDAVIEVFQRQSIRWGDLGVVYAKPPDCPEGYVFDALEDGCEVTIPLSVGFKVDAEY
jgi:hypothetical protein